MSDEIIKIESSENCNCEGTEEEIKAFKENTGEDCWCAESGGDHGVIMDDEKVESEEE